MSATHTSEKDLEAFAPEVDLPLDAGIRRAVLILRSAGVETFESCEGGLGHAYPEPTVRFHGIYADGFKALSVAMTYGLPVTAIRRIWTMQDGEPAGPWWEIMTSIYWWQGALEQADEAVLILKTRAELVERLTARIMELHSYECPCVVALPIAAGNSQYLDRVAGETGPT